MLEGIEYYRSTAGAPSLGHPKSSDLRLTGRQSSTCSQTGVCFQRCPDCRDQQTYCGTQATIITTAVCGSLAAVANAAVAVLAAGACASACGPAAPFCAAFCARAAGGLSAVVVGATCAQLRSDVAISAQESLEENAKQLCQDLTQILTWGKEHKVVFDYRKCELLHFTRSSDTTHSPEVTADGFDLTIKEEQDLAMRWLGVWFDRKVSFNHHVKKRTAQANMYAVSPWTYFKGSPTRLEEIMASSPFPNTECSAARSRLQDCVCTKTTPAACTACSNGTFFAS
ncbi:hypothetical protein S40293_11509 [Stachybotrys chartarum IBT 40293]|nr:hypothetical protein S40293_11509 [Stachybotrys chartarum IBT 40293]